MNHLIASTGLIGLRCILSVGLFTLWASAAANQINTGEISGVVRDSLGGVLPGATVIATHDATGIVVERAAGDDGRYFLPALPIGAWTVEARHSGLTARTHRIFLEGGRSVALDFSLSVQGLSEQVEVQRTLPLLQVTTAEISDVIENREVVQLPLNGRNFLALAQLSDAVVIPPGGTRGEALQQAGPLPNVGGQRSGHNIYLLDGAKVTDELFNNLVINCQRRLRALRGSSQLEFRWEEFNLLNRANVDLPNRIFDNANFGRIFSAKSPREMQFGLRLTF